MRRPKLTRLAETLLNPLVGKSVAMYFSKHFTERPASEDMQNEAKLGHSVASG
jgi:hypothetical protein